MKYRVRFSDDARRDIEDLLDHILIASGERIAFAYIDRLERFCLGFETFPKRGTARPQDGIDLRTVGFERSATVAFSVKDDEVMIVRILYRGRSFVFQQNDDLPDG
ncbi:type II toxin-antitoxin system RelE/ParE family toxin [Rhizobium sp. DKSPLA3]|uniref:Type II toxin-antitoxin system RelE/ParE family toxin n=1 Tax=Rhizobium quercicola TaxID=2901226 RepID=A0A9X1NUS4_9HYPH|nr:type II toxin-antitoxin system RelE/ParE family toxin [Rhizobium quercicola]MCD7110341.1 type II toxin-antitoxin system RelE/ParE family toxin [Rhizobium quercicola]